jgi:hypothetical protein
MKGAAAFHREKLDARLKPGALKSDHLCPLVDGDPGRFLVGPVACCPYQQVATIHCEKRMTLRSA